MSLPGLILRFPRGVWILLWNRPARRAVHGLAMLRRTYEHLLMTAVLEGAREIRGPYYQDYVDALEIIGTRAEWIARAL